MADGPGSPFTLQLYVGEDPPLITELAVNVTSTAEHTVLPELAIMPTLTGNLGFTVMVVGAEFTHEFTSE